MSTIVGTNIEVTNLKYDSDTTAMVIASDGDLTISTNDTTITGEGSATMKLQSGLVKAWCNHSASAFLGPTLNYASFTDHGTGDHTGNFTSNMANITYVFGTAGEGGTDVVRYVYKYSPATTGCRFRTAYVTHAVAPTIADLGGNGNQITGDLA